MKRKLYIIAAFLVLMLFLTACVACDRAQSQAASNPDTSGDTVVRFADATPDSGERIDIPGYENLTMQAGSKSQKVYLYNPQNNAAYFVLTLTLSNGETLWTGKKLYPGEAFTGIVLKKSLKAGNYTATLHYNCFSVNNNEPLNGAEVQLNLTVDQK